MGGTPDRKAGPSYEEGTYYDTDALPAAVEGEVRYANGAFSLCDSLGEYDPRSGGSGVDIDKYLVFRDGIYLAFRTTGNLVSLR